MDSSGSATPYEPLHFPSDNDTPDANQQPSAPPEQPRVAHQQQQQQQQQQQAPVQQQPQQIVQPPYPVVQPQYGVPPVQPQVLVTQPQPVVIQVSSRPRSAPVIKENYRSRGSRILGILQLVFGVFAFALGIAGLVLNSVEYVDPSVSRTIGSVYYTGSYSHGQNGVYFGGVGIWCLIFFVLSGSFALCAGAKKTRCLIIAHLVLAIFASVFAFIMLSIAFWAFGQDVNRIQKGFYVDLWGYDHSNQESKQLYDGAYDHDAAIRTKSTLAVSTLWVIASIVEFVCCVWSTTLCCRVLCCSTSDTSRSAVQYSTTPGPNGTQVLILDSQGRPIPGAQIIQLPPANGQVNQGDITQTRAPLNTYQGHAGGFNVSTMQAPAQPPPYKS